MNTAHGEAFKEALRWAAFFVVSWIVTETLKQAAAIPEHMTLNVWVFHYVLPFRELLVTLLTLIGRGVDKYLFEKSKAAITWASDKPQGLLPW
jgi:hypothetical protein